MNPLTEMPASNVKLTDLNPHLICILCGGYFVDATTITECLHSFCKSCIIKYLEHTRNCPICDCQIHKTRPHVNLRLDKTLQDLVYKLVPQMYSTEMRRRREYYSQHPEAKPDSPGEARGDEMPERFVYSKDEKISLVLEYSADGAPSRRGMTSGPVSHQDTRTRKNVRAEPHWGARYLLCPALVPVSVLKKFLRMKLDLQSHLQIDIFHTNEPLGGALTLIDIANLHTWTRTRPLQLFYSIFDALPNGESQAAAASASTTSATAKPDTTTALPSTSTASQPRPSGKEDVAKVSSSVSKVSSTTSTKAASASSAKAAPSTPAKAVPTSLSKAPATSSAKVATSAPARASTSPAAKTATSVPAKAATSAPLKAAISAPPKTATSASTKSTASVLVKVTESAPVKAPAEAQTKTAVAAQAKPSTSTQPKSASKTPSKAAAKAATSAPVKTPTTSPSKTPVVDKDKVTSTTSNEKPAVVAKDRALVKEAKENKPVSKDKPSNIRAAAPAKEMDKTSPQKDKLKRPASPIKEPEKPSTSSREMSGASALAKETAAASRSEMERIGPPPAKKRAEVDPGGKPARPPMHTNSQCVSEAAASKAAEAVARRLPTVTTALPVPPSTIPKATLTPTSTLALTSALPPTSALTPTPTLTHASALTPMPATPIFFTSSTLNSVVLPTPPPTPLYATSLFRPEGTSYGPATPALIAVQTSMRLPTSPVGYPLVQKMQDGSGSGQPRRLIEGAAIKKGRMEKSLEGAVRRITEGAVRKSGEALVERRPSASSANGSAGSSNGEPPAKLARKSPVHEGAVRKSGFPPDAGFKRPFATDASSPYSFPGRTGSGVVNKADASWSPGHTNGGSTSGEGHCSPASQNANAEEQESAVDYRIHQRDEPLNLVKAKDNKGVKVNGAGSTSTANVSPVSSKQMPLQIVG